MAYIYIYILTFYLAFFLAYTLTLSLTFFLAFYLTSILTFFLAFYLAAMYLAYLLAFYLMYLMRFFAVEVRRGSLLPKGGTANIKSNNPRLRGGRSSMAISMGNNVFEQLVDAWWLFPMYLSHFP